MIGKLWRIIVFACYTTYIIWMSGFQLELETVQLQLPFVRIVQVLTEIAMILIPAYFLFRKYWEKP